MELKEGGNIAEMEPKKLDQAAVSIRSGQKLPDFPQSVKLKYVKLGYHYVISHAMYLLFCPIAVLVAAEVGTLGPEDLYELWQHLRLNLPFNPTPSLSAMIINHYKLRGNITSYNLGGMGCSAGLISIDLAKDLLQ
ncbi:hypothetical protein KI387_037648, partial [Taxus chinensis]